jgi:hypothetical protein
MLLSTSSAGGTAEKGEAREPGRRGEFEQGMQCLLYFLISTFLYNTNIINSFFDLH